MYVARRISLANSFNYGRNSTVATNARDRDRVSLFPTKAKVHHCQRFSACQQTTHSESRVDELPSSANEIADSRTRRSGSETRLEGEAAGKLERSTDSRLALEKSRQSHLLTTIIFEPGDPDEVGEDGGSRTATRRL